ncbi:MAG: putative toxin-antitoxin system toxin component, PIN family [Sphingobacteriia bacterium]|nr:putative toxin-antitoxin system toxin component, PIN family [Sphingobacteriia bacterium]
MPKKKNRVIIDTNLWLSFLLTNDFSKLDKIFTNKSAVLIFSRHLLDEFIEVAQRPKFKKYFSLTDLERLLVQIKEDAEFIEVVSNVQLCRDPKDDFLLSLAKDGKATHLITGDKDLLDIKVVGKTKIITIANYLSNE